MITSINLASSPFMGSCDSTRAQMAAKQIAQALTHENCQIPYVISNEYNIITENSPSSGVLIAQYDGTIIYKGSDLLIIYYTTIDKLEIKYIPILKKTTGIYASKLRYCINKPEFKKGEILYYYDCFIEGIPTYGYNTFCGYLVNFGFNHEDSLVVSNSFAKKAKHRYIETVYIPIYEYTMMKPLYINDKNSFIYFPNIGQHIKDHLICSKIQPKISDVSQYNNIKTRMMILLNTMNISDLMNIENKSSQFDIDEIKTEIKNGTLSGFKIHKLKKDSILIDTKLQETLEQMYLLYANNYIIDLYKELSSKFTDNFTNQVLRKYLMYSENDFTLNKKDIKDCTYLIELEITKEAECQIGDKYCNRYAGKGVVSIQIPDELRPIALSSQMPIDFIFNVFSVFSRMNISQIQEALISKSVMYCDNFIKTSNNKEEILNLLSGFLNDKIIKHLGDDTYYDKIKNLLNTLQQDDTMYNNFIDNVKQNNLYVEAPAFSVVNIKELYKNAIPCNEDVLIKKEYIEYMEDALKTKCTFTKKDTVIKNMFCAPLYIMKLYKLVASSITARDFGPYKYITKQPIKGRMVGGASRLGQMELEGLIANGITRGTQEFLTVKSDYIDGKPDLCYQMAKNGKYNMPDIKIKGGTSRVVSILSKFLNK